MLSKARIAIKGEIGARYLCWPKGETIAAYKRINNSRKSEFFGKVSLNFHCRKKLRRANPLANKVVNFKKREKYQMGCVRNSPAAA